jgi:hypothetical protein
VDGRGPPARTLSVRWTPGRRKGLRASRTSCLASHAPRPSLAKVPLDERTADLTERRTAVYRLLDEPYDWRVRAVERLEVTSALYCGRHRSLQVAPLRPLLGDLIPGNAEKARIILPIASLPKGALRELNLLVPNPAGASLLNRRAIAELEAGYVIQLAAQVGLTVSEQLAGLLTAVCEFDAGEWRPVHRRYQRNRLDGLVAYLSPRVPTLTLPALCRAAHYSARAGEILVERLAEGPERESAADSAALTLPLLWERGVVQNDEQAVQALEQWWQLVLTLDRAASLARGPGPGARGPGPGARVSRATYCSPWRTMADAGT